MCCLVGGRVRLGGSPEWSWGQVRWGHSSWGYVYGMRGTRSGHARHAQWACTARTVGMHAAGMRSVGSVTHSCSDYHSCSRSPRIVAMSVEIVS